MKKIPIYQARRVTNEFDLDGAILIGFKKTEEGNLGFSITSYGDTVAFCRELKEVVDNLGMFLSSGSHSYGVEGAVKS